MTRILVAAGLAAVVAVTAAAAPAPEDGRVGLSREFIRKAEALLPAKPATAEEGMASPYDGILGNLAAAKQRQRDYAGAKMEIGRMAVPFSQAMRYDFLANAQFLDGDVKAAQGSLNMVLALKLDDYERNIVLAWVGETRAQMGDIEGAKKALAMSSDSSRKARIWLAIGKAEARGGQRVQADAAFAAAARAVTKDPMDTSGLAEIAIAQWECGEAEAARTTLKSEPDSRQRAMTWLRLGAGISGDSPTDTSVSQRKAALEEAAKVYERSPADQAALKADGYSVISGNLAQMGDLVAAENFWPLIDTCINAKAIPGEMTHGADAAALKTLGHQLVVSGWLHLALAQLAAGDEGAYRKTLAAAWVEADMLTGKDRGEACITMASNLAEYGQPEDAAKAIDEALAVPNMEPVEVNMLTPAAISLTTRYGMKADLSWIEKLPGADLKAEAYSCAAMGLLATDKHHGFFPM